MAIFDIVSVDCVPEGILARNRALSDAPPACGRGHLAIVGGGSSIESRIGELLAHKGDIWAINGAWRWCAERGIPAWFYSADPRPNIAKLCNGAPVILADHADPETWAKAGEKRMVKGPYIGPSSATSTLRTALHAGYRKMTYYGCESSWSENTHAYEHKPTDDWLQVRVGGNEFVTNLHLLHQAEVLAEVLRAAPNVYNERSGGLLAALIESPKWDAICGAKDLVDRLMCPAA